MSENTEEIRKLAAALDGYTKAHGGIKKGVSSTEFYLGLVVTVILIGADAFGLNLSVETVSGLVGTVASYTLGRSFVKAKEVENKTVKK